MSDYRLEILKRIPRNRLISATELYQQMLDQGMRVTRRSFQRYMKGICNEYEVEVDCTSKPHGYRWKEYSAGLTLPGLNAQEALLLLLAEQQLSPLLPASLKAGLYPFFEQARRLLGTAHLTDTPGGKKRQAREWLDKVRVVPTTVPMLPPKMVDGVFEAVSEALLQNHWLNVSYRNAQGQTKTKRIMPLGLAQQGPRLFLVCLFDGYTDTRNLALHRIQSAQNTYASFERPANFDLKTYDDRGQFAYGTGEKIQLRLWVNHYLTLLMEETPLSADQTLQPMEEPTPWAGDQARLGALLQATVVQSDLLVRWLRGQGKGVRVLGPASLADRL